MFFAKPLQRSNLCASHRQRRWLTHGELINVSNGYHLWSERFDRDMDDVLEVQDQITQSVVEKLKVKLLGGADTPLVKRPTDNVESLQPHPAGPVPPREGDRGGS